VYNGFSERSTVTKTIVSIVAVC